MHAMCAVELRAAVKEDHLALLRLLKGLHQLVQRGHAIIAFRNNVLVSWTAAQDLDALLRRVAHDGDLAGRMRLGDRRQGGPPQSTPLLLVERYSQASIASCLVKAAA